MAVLVKPVQVANVKDGVLSTLIRIRILLLVIKENMEHQIIIIAEDILIIRELGATLLTLKNDPRNAVVQVMLIILRKSCSHFFSQKTGVLRLTDTFDYKDFPRFHNHIHVQNNSKFSIIRNIRKQHFSFGPRKIG